MIHNSATALGTPSITKDSNLKVDPNYIVVAAPDLRGVGDSSKPPTGYDGKTVAEDIHQLVTQLGFKTIFLVGDDLGSFVVYPYAAAHPSEVKGLVVMDVLPAGAITQNINEYVSHYSAPGGMVQGEYYRTFPQNAIENQNYSKKASNASTGSRSRI